MAMRVLLTGSSGWLGRFLAPVLQRAGHEVIGIDVAPGDHTKIISSIADLKVVQQTFSNFGIEAVIHAGALHKPDIVRQTTQAFIDVNLTGTLNLLTCAVRHGVSSFVFTSTTSLMISQAIRAETSTAAVWLDERSGPLEPRNIYGVTKLAAEGLCRDAFLNHGLPCVVLRTSRFFPEDDDTHSMPTGENLKANELLYRRATVEDMARAHVLALEQAPQIGFDVLIISAPTPFTRDDVIELKRDAGLVVQKYFPDAAALYEARRWTLPATIGRIYDAARAEQILGFRAQTDFAALLEALKHGHALPFAHDPSFIPPHADLNFATAG
jgi:UDP-glucose 4-epimerase